jgi:hypothetical protein
MSIEMDKLLEAYAKLADAQAYIRHCIRLCGVADKNIIEPVEEVDEAFLDFRLEDVDFGGSTTRLRNAFTNHNRDLAIHGEGDFRCNGGYFNHKIETVRDLVNFSERDLLAAYNIGRLSVNRMKTVLAAHGLSFREE